jgi:myo-inositol catabolism protein IolS
MEFVTVPQLGRPASVVGFGCWGIGGHGYGIVDDDDSVAAIRRALDLGINVFDTADVYGFGHSESVLGRALAGRWDEAVVVTKFGVAWKEGGETWKDSSPERARAAVEGSLRRLGVDSIPLYLVHWLDGHTPVEDTMDALGRLKDEGKIQAFGLSNVTGTALGQSLMAGPAAVQLNFGLANRTQESALRDAVRRGMFTMAYGALSRGVLSGEYREGHRFASNDTRAADLDFSGERLRRRLSLVDHLARVGEAYGRTPAEVALRWALDAGCARCVVVGMTKAEQVEVNARLPEWRLSADDWSCLGQLGNELLAG